MKVELLSQKQGTRLGDVLKKNLNPRVGKWTKFRAAVAFAKQSGLEHLAPALTKFLKKNGEVVISVGVDLDGTSQEALQLLHNSVVQHQGDVWVFHNSHRIMPTFHPKLYFFRDMARACVVVGSGNLTQGGLFTNYEANVKIDLDLNQPDDCDFANQIEDKLKTWAEKNTGGLAIPLQSALIQKLSPMAPPEAALKATKRGAGAGRGSGGLAAAKLLFGTVKIASAPKPAKTPRGGVAPVTPTKPSSAAPSLGSRRVASPSTAARIPHAIMPPAAGPSLPKSPQPAVRGRLLWEKKLSATDAQHQPGHAVGGVRLTQAKFKNPAGILIDHRTYFRNTLFGKFAWTVRKQKPRVEATQVRFDIELLGQPCGVHQLTISDKQSGAARQGNYTSILHWGNLQSTVSAQNLTGRTLSIYAPSPGSGDPYFIVVS